MLPADNVVFLPLSPRLRTMNDSSAEWATYNELGRLAACNQTIRLQFSLYNPSSSIRACSVSSHSPSAKAAQAPASKKFESQEVSLELGWWNTPTSSSPVGAKAAVEEAQRALLTSSNNKSTTAFSYSGNSLVGLYAGHGVLHSDAATTVLQHFTQYLESQKTIARVLLQYCGVNSNKALGIVVDTTGDFSAVQRIMRDWNEAKCQTGFDGSKKLPNTALRLERPFAQTSSTTDHLARRNSHHGAHHVHSIHRRATCKTIQVASGDSCGSLAKECGITGAKFEEYNPDKKLCSTLSVGQYVCCTSGDLPDLTPKPEPDGTCASVLVEPGDICSTIAAANGISIEDLENFNKKTWGWAGCDRLQPKQRICLSKGNPAMPESIENAVCGPQVPGTKQPAKGTDLADLNPCPLKTCCNIWGQCGITDDFCTITESETGAPGTAANGTYGCISNCGTDIVNNDTPPDSFITIGYFEAWNFERECLNMDIAYFDTSAYSHLHFAFAEITEDYQVDVSAVQSQFDSLLNMGEVHRVLSFGGWSFSTEVDTFPIFREGVTDANRELFATNVVNFIVDNDLEGVDFDWEYPGAPDIPGIPAGDEGDGERYLQFLKLVREKLPDSKTLAIAAPASFWYLKGFPIAEISKVVDYIVYMTYDLHGQWDYGNQYSTSGCSEGDCLRSHVNLTETTSALSMITKAGVSSDKIIVGLASYGRSFKMTKAGCTGPMCRFVGPDSGAAKGECTDTAGYISDAEIYRILDEDDTAETFYDNSSDSNILVYRSTEWVAFMDEHTRTSRTGYYERLNMGGTTDWAVDLQAFGFSGGGNGGHGGGGGSLNQSIVYISPSIWTDGKDPAPVQCPAPCVLVLPDFPLSSTSVISRPPYVTTLDVAWPTAATLTTGGSTVTTTTVTRILQETTIKAPAVTVTSLPMANLNITVPIKGNSTITITPKPRFPAQTVTITNDPNPLGITGVSHPPVTRSVTLPPWPQGTVIYYPKDSVDNGEDHNNDDNDDDGDDDDDNDDDGDDDDSNDDDGNDDDDSNDDDGNDDDGNDDDDDDGDDDNNNDDDDIDLPPIPAITVKNGPGSPGCGADEDCGGLCSSPLDFCSCFICPGGGGAGDGGFSDPNDPNPPPRPPGDPVNNKGDGPDSSCTQTSTETNYWVSCESLGSTSTSCTTTSSMLAIGCDITATTTTTGEGVCSSFNPDEDQGDSNGRGSGGPPTTVPTVSATTTTTNNEPSTSSETTTTTKTSTTSSLPSTTAASGCTRVGGDGPSISLRCWNKCDPDTGSPVGGDWAENDPWCWIAESGSDSYATCLKQSDCPTDFECAKSWGCVVPLSGGCASQRVLGKTCWSSCNEKTGKRTNDKWEEGMPWCWVQNGAFASCDEDDNCSATTECAPDYWSHGGCDTNSKT
ncbi:uncharacterized protein ATNIH1004_005471 [Aspergillus tanneri]|uniref:chitinase n=1 Tax=Aspergillus tanneri TaxID=1220188 RepID=A0A5M9MLL4_9EURO|nr:uncharacterized protein ATNIH1004_005471 [Aspergillus tanneri]KAA8646796.1 hypothetical protein ATNIH1004_005471 [Aspergillus tanneri]